MFPKSFYPFAWAGGERIPSLGELMDALGAYPARDCAAHEMSAVGWCPPVDGDQLVRVVHPGVLVMCCSIQERILPAQVVKDELAKRLETMDQPVSRHVRLEVKDLVTAELMAKSFTRTTRVLAYIDPVRRMLVVCSATGRLVDRVTESLRNALGSLPVRGLGDRSSGFGVAVTDRMLGGDRLGEAWALCGAAVLEGDDKNSVRVRGVDLDSDEVVAHLNGGMSVRSVRLSFSEVLEVMVDLGSLACSSIKYTGYGLAEKGDADPAVAFDADAMLMVDMIGLMLDAALAYEVP